MRMTLKELTQESILCRDNGVELGDTIDIWHFDKDSKESPDEDFDVYLSKDDAITLAGIIKSAIVIGLDINPDDPIAGLQDAYQSYKFFLQKLEATPQ